MISERIGIFRGTDGTEANEAKAINPPLCEFLNISLPWTVLWMYRFVNTEFRCIVVVVFCGHKTYFVTN